MYRFLTPGQSSQLQRAAAIISELADDAKHKGDELLAASLSDICKDLRRVIDDREKARERYLNENRLPDSP
jgi:vacuolar-type H+-ATPase subunit H